MAEKSFDLQPEDYTDPACPFCTDQYQKGPPVKSIPTGRVLDKLDEHFAKNDYAGAERHLLYWRGEADLGHDRRGALLIANELMGLYRKTGRLNEAKKEAETALSLAGELGVEEETAGGTALLNAATVYKAAGEPERSLALFQKARAVLEKAAPDQPGLLAGLYNNMALTLVDLARFDEAEELYDKALDLLTRTGGGQADAAVTWLNMADLYTARDGAEAAESRVATCIERAAALLDSPELPRDGYYAFVCEKCAPTFGYYGYFLLEQTYRERAQNIYERT